MEYFELARKEFEEAENVGRHFLENDENFKKIAAAAAMITQCFKQDGKVISCGNGGSHCDAMHFAEELSGRYRENRKAYPAIAISDPSHISCVGNDFGFDSIFSRFIEGFGKKGDVLLAISTSGNSANVLRAATLARQKGMNVISLTGKNGGKLAELSDIEIRVHHQGYADRIQEVHIKIIHALILLIEKMMA
jgi:D-sedoheptulose 7-phosphate isomerase